MMIQGLHFFTSKLSASETANEADIRLSPTICLTSMAAECAEHHGIPKEIVDRARFVTSVPLFFFRPRRSQLIIPPNHGEVVADYK